MTVAVGMFRVCWPGLTDSSIYGSSFVLDGTVFVTT